MCAANHYCSAVAPRAAEPSREQFCPGNISWQVFLTGWGFSKFWNALQQRFLCHWVMFTSCITGKLLSLQRVALKQSEKKSYCSNPLLPKMKFHAYVKHFYTSFATFIKTFQVFWREWWEFSHSNRQQTWFSANEKTISLPLKWRFITVCFYNEHCQNLWW